MNSGCESEAIVGNSELSLVPSAEAQRDGQSPKHRFLIFVAELLHRYGTPSFRFEAAMAAVSDSAGIRGSFLYTPTSFIASLEEQGTETTYLRRVDADDVDIDKLLSFDAVLEELKVGRISVQQAHAQLAHAAGAQPLYHWTTNAFAAAVVCGGVASLFQGGVWDVVVAFVLGFLVAVLTWIVKGRQWNSNGWLHPFCGFFAGSTAIVISQFVPIDFRITTLAVLILPIPGLSLTIALTELAVGHLSAGSGRFAGAMTCLLTLTFGVAVAWRLAGGIGAPENIVRPLPEWCQWVALSLAPLSFAVLFRSPVFLWPAIVLTSIVGSFVNRLSGDALGPELGAFCAAFTIGACSNLYARLYNRPAMAILTPGLLTLVPGSIGYRSITAMFDHNASEGIELGAVMLMTAISLVGGILMANAVLSPKRCL